MPTSYHRVEHQNGSGPPPEFPQASASAGIVHCLSGPTNTTHRSPTATAFTPSPRCIRGLLGPCFNTGPRSRLPPHFHCFTTHWRLFIFPSRYLCTIGLVLIFSLGCSYHPFALHYQTALLIPRVRCRAITRSGSAFHQISRYNTHTTLITSLPSGLILVRSPLLKKSAFVSFPGLTDMLKSRPSSYYLQRQ